MSVHDTQTMSFKGPDYIVSKQMRANYKNAVKIYVTKNEHHPD